MANKVFRGDRLKQARESQCLTQVELARRLGTVQNQIYRYEKGTSEPLPEQIVGFARHLEISADWLLGDTKKTIAEKTLSPQERNFIEALRRRNFRQLIGLIAEIIPDNEENSDGPPLHPQQ